MIYSSHRQATHLLISLCLFWLVPGDFIQMVNTKFQKSLRNRNLNWDSLFETAFWSLSVPVVPLSWIRQRSVSQNKILKVPSVPKGKEWSYRVNPSQNSSVLRGPSQPKSTIMSDIIKLRLAGRAHNERKWPLELHEEFQKASYCKIRHFQISSICFQLPQGPWLIQSGDHASRGLGSVEKVTFALCTQTAGTRNSHRLLLGSEPGSTYFRARGKLHNGTLFFMMSLHKMYDYVFHTKYNTHHNMHSDPPECSLTCLLQWRQLNKFCPD